jgi:hypothetical protein
MWWLYRAASGPQNQTWTEQAIESLTAQGYNRTDIDTAIDHYLHGGMTAKDAQIISAAIASVGTPDMPNVPTDQVVTPATGVSPNSGVADATDSPDIMYWYVVSTGVGWTSSFSGIAQQFYGDSGKGSIIQQLNPNVSTTTYGRIPPGVRIKVPRSIAA